MAAATPVVTGAERIGNPPALPWPAQGQAALLVEGPGSLGASGGGRPAPMASTAKMMTALLVLEDHPLALNQPGPVLTVSRADVTTYFTELNQGESVVPVVAGEQMSEYQLLQGLLLPSGSNLAVILAVWDQGSVAAFVNRMNQRATALGMAATHYADVSGFSAASVSTPADLIALAQVTMRQPVFAQIVAQSQATLPVAGVIHNLDTLLGKNGIVGIKTGHTDQAGGCFVFAADINVDGRAVRVFGAVMGQPNALAGAFSATTALLNGLRPALHLRSITQRGDVIARYSMPWGETGNIVAAQSVSWILLDGAAIQRRPALSPLPAGLAPGSAVGTLSLDAGPQHAVIQVLTQSAINGPDLGWRLTRGF